MNPILVSLAMGDTIERIAHKLSGEEVQELRGIQSQVKELVTPDPDARTLTGATGWTFDYQLGRLFLPVDITPEEQNQLMPQFINRNFTLTTGLRLDRAIEELRRARENG